MRQRDLKWHGIEFSQPALAEARWLLRERILYLVKSSPYLFYKTRQIEVTVQHFDKIRINWDKVAFPIHKGKSQPTFQNSLWNIVLKFTIVYNGFNELLLLQNPSAHLHVLHGFDNNGANKNLEKKQDQLVWRFKGKVAVN